MNCPRCGAAPSVMYGEGHSICSNGCPGKINVEPVLTDSARAKKRSQRLGGDKNEANS